MKIIESPREGMQSLPYTVPTERKIKYLNNLLRVGFDTVELGSIVSRKLIPQMADTINVLGQLDFSFPRSNRMILVVSTKGGEIISKVKEVTHISYPFSISPTFLRLNLNASTGQSFDTVRNLAQLCADSGKQLVIYISMAFGNPYGDPWSPGLLSEWIGKLHEAGVRIIPLSNVAIEIDKDLIREVYSLLIPGFPDIEFGLHLHTTNQDWYEKVDAAYECGCRRFDSVINGYGGCPMSGKEMLGNLKTENLVSFATDHGGIDSIDRQELKKAYDLVGLTFIEPVTFKRNIEH